MNKNRRITLMVALGLLISTIIGLNAHQTIRRLIDMNKWLVHSHLVINRTQRVLTLLTNLDNDLRGHLLSRNAYFKADFDQNAREMMEQLKSIQTLTVDNPAQQKRVQTMTALFRQKVARGQTLFEAEGIAMGTARLDSINHYLKVSDRFHQVLREAESHENVLLEARAAQNKRSANYATWSNLIGAIAAFAMIIWAIYLLFQALRNSTKLNQQLAESDQQTKKILEAVPVSIVVVDHEGKFYYANGAAHKLYGTDQQFNSYTDVLKSIQFFRYPGGQPYPLEERPTYRALQGQAAQADDLEIRLDGKAIQVFSSSSPVYDASGKLQYVIASSIDISDRVQSQQRLQEAKEMAENAAKIKENFLANMSHEIRTPLNAILGFSDLLNTTPLNTEQKEFVDFVRTAGKSLLTIVNDILDLSKIDAGMIKLESIPFSIHLLTASIKTMFQTSAIEKDLHLKVETDPELPSVLLGDPTRLTQILLNLLSNAIKFTKHGGVTLRIEKEHETPEAVRVRFIVQDTGIGIEPEVLPTIFERFQQANDFTTRFYGGTGLGLNIVKSLAELQGGSVRVESVVGEGTQFTVELTYAIANQQTGVDEPIVSAAVAPDERLVHVLVVEDNLINQKLILQVIKRLGYQVRVADNGQKALELLQAMTFDIVLMDIQMPVMDGYETTRRIRTTLKSAVPIIAMTAHALVSEREECLRAGMNDFLSKPFQVDDLQRLIRKYLLARESTDGLATQDEPAAQPSANYFVESLVAAVGNDTDLAHELLEMYVSQTPQEVDELQMALSQNDLETVGRIIHSQKVHTKMLGMTEATRLILESEALAKAQKGIGQVGPLVRQYIDEVNQILPQLRAYLETIAGRPV